MRRAVAMGGVFSRQPVTVSPDTHSFQATTQAGTLVYVALSKKSIAAAAAITESRKIDHTLFFGLHVPFEELVIESKLGTGNFGVVYKAYYQGKHVAVKKLLVHQYSHKMVEDFQRELEILSILTHPNIVQFLGAVLEPPTLCLITELCAGSLVDLLQLARHQKLSITWGLTLEVALDCAKACAYLHQLNPAVLHRDIKVGLNSCVVVWVVCVWCVCESSTADDVHLRTGREPAHHRSLPLQAERLWALAQPRARHERQHHVRHAALARSRGLPRRGLLGEGGRLLVRHRAMVGSLP